MAKELTYYTLTPDPKVEKAFTIRKFDDGLDMVSEYILNYIPSSGGGYYDCNCPASIFDCRHKKIMKSIIAAGEVGSGKFFCFETKTFHLPREI